MARRNKEHEEHENLERWLVSYADFITLLFAFFVVMYALSSINEGKYRVLSTAIVEAFRTGNQPSIIHATPGEANTQIAVPGAKPIDKQIKGSVKTSEQAKMNKLASSLAQVVEPLLKGGQVNIRQTPLGIQVEIRDSALFPSGQATISPQSAKVLGDVAKILAPLPNPVRVEGFTDNVPISSAQFPSNWELSAARAGSVVRLFEENGLPAPRMVAVGRGENLPVASNDTDAGRTKNRRVQITVLSGDVPEADSVPMTAQ
jgi:chemotaxis protein MotB